MNTILGQLKKEYRLLLAGLGREIKLSASIGLDIGSKYFRAVRIKRPGNEFSVKDTCIDHLQKLNELKDIMQIDSEEEISINFDEEAVTIKRVSIPVMPYEEIEGALRWELKRQVSFDMDKARVRFNVLGEREYDDRTKKIEIIALTYKEDAIESKVNELRRIDLNIQNVIPSDFALLNYVNTLNLVPSGEGLAVVDIGAVRTTISIIEDKKLSFTRDLAIGGDTITEAMTVVLVSEQGRVAFSKEEAERVKCEQGITEDIKILSMMRPVLERFATNIKRSLEYYEHQFKTGSIKKIILAGNGAKLKGLKEYLAKEIGADVLTVLPEIACAVGLALDGGADLNMLPERFKIEKRTALQKLSIRMIVIITGFLFLFSYGVLSVKSINLKKELKIQKLHLETIKEVKLIKDRMVGLISTMNIVRSDDVDTTKIMKELSHETLPDIMLENFTIKNTEPNLSISGVVLSGESLSKFMSNLAASSLFEKVKLISSEKNEKYTAGALDFEISCNVRR